MLHKQDFSSLWSLSHFPSYQLDDYSVQVCFSPCSLAKFERLTLNSEDNPVPTIQRFEEEQKRRDEQENGLEEALESENAVRSDTMDTADIAKSNEEEGEEGEEDEKGLTEGQKEKKHMMEKMQKKQGPMDAVKSVKGQRIVDDPVTGEKVTIKDARFKGACDTR